MQKLKVRSPYITSRAGLIENPVDIGGRDIIIGFNEPAVRSGKQSSELYAQLNARLPAYFIPAVDVAKSQKTRPMLYVASGINLAMRWNAKNDKQKRMLLAHNKIKFDFLQNFFSRFFPDDFSVIEYAVVQDPIRVPEDTLTELWQAIAKKYPERAEYVKFALARFSHPEWSSGKEGKEKLETYVREQTGELEDSFKYALAHSFTFGDINFDGNYYLNPNGFASIGGHQEKYFNEMRNLAFEFVDLLRELCKGQEILTRDNVQIIIEEPASVPPPYSGATRGNSKSREFDEVTYENGRDLEYYDDRPKLQPDMEYIYQHIPRGVYEKFWLEYKGRYKDLKGRYQEAYKLILDGIVEN